MNNEISSEMLAAMEWLVRLHDDRAPADLSQQFDLWLASAPENRRAWQEANKLWLGLEPVKTEYDAMRRKDRLVSRRYVLSGLATLATASVSTAVWQVSRSGFGADYATDAGETRSITLADGSLLNLGSRSALSLDFNQDQRHVHLQSGEAFFSAASVDPRPFVVSALRGMIRTHGAQFNVNIGASQVRVEVASSMVLLQPPNRQDLSLSAGWRAAYSADQLYPAQQIDIASIGAWRQGRLVFENAPLRDVLAEIERWRGGRIAVLDQKTADIPVSAVFDAAKPQMALDTVVEVLNLRRIDLPGGISFIYA
jgi:transmembrane sensor